MKRVLILISLSVWGLSVQGMSRLTPRQNAIYADIKVRAATISLKDCTKLADEFKTKKEFVTLKIDRKENTVLHIFAKHNRADIAAVLLSWGADKQVRNKSEVTPQSLAEYKDAKDVMKLFSSREDEVTRGLTDVQKEFRERVIACVKGTKGPKDIEAFYTLIGDGSSGDVDVIPYSKSQTLGQWLDDLFSKQGTAGQVHLEVAPYRKNYVQGLMILLNYCVKHPTFIDKIRIFFNVQKKCDITKLRFEGGATIAKWLMDNAFKVEQRELSILIQKVLSYAVPNIAHPTAAVTRYLHIRSCVKAALNYISKGTNWDDLKRQCTTLRFNIDVVLGDKTMMFGKMLDHLLHGFKIQAHTQKKYERARHVQTLFNPYRSQRVAGNKLASIDGLGKPTKSKEDSKEDKDDTGSKDDSSKNPEPSKQSTDIQDTDKSGNSWAGVLKRVALMGGIVYLAYKAYHYSDSQPDKEKTPSHHLNVKS